MINFNLMDSLYFIAIVPPEEIEKEIEDLKKYFATHFNSKAALRSPGHLTLYMPFRWKEAKEKLLIEKLNLFAKGKETFNVILKYFGAFPPRVLFINVEANETLHNFQKQLLQSIKVDLKLFNGNYKEKPFHPHVTVAFRDLKKRLFYPAYEEFKNKEFTRSFLVDHISLLKHNGKEWRVIDNLFFA